MKESKTQYPLRFEDEDLKTRVYEAAEQRKISINEYINKVLRRGVKPLRAS